MERCRQPARCTSRRHSFAKRPADEERASSARSYCCDQTSSPRERHRAHAGMTLSTRVFSSEMEAGSRQENASNQESRAPFRFYRNGKGSNSPSARRRRRPATGLESPTRCRPPKECPRWKNPVVQGMNGSEYSRRPRVFCPCRDIDTRRVLKSRLQDRSHLNTGATTG